MKWSDDEIDQVFKRVASEQKVEYKDAYWTEMQAMLDAEKPSKKPVGWWFFSGLMALLLVLGGFYYSSVNTKTKGEGATQARLDFVNEENLSTSLTSKEEQPLNFKSVDLDGSNSFVKVDNPASLLVSSPATLEIKRTQTASRNQDYSEGVKGVKQNEDKSTQVLSENFVKINDAFNGVEVTHTTIQNDGRLNLPDYRSSHLVNEIEAIQNVAETDENGDFTTLNMKKSDLEEMTYFQNGLMVSNVEEPVLSDKRSGYYVGANFGAASPYLSQSKHLTTQWSVLMGYDYTFVKNVRLGIGVGFRQQMVQGMEIKNQRDYYSLGLVSYNQAIKYDRFNFIDVNVHFHYIFKQFSFGVFASPTFLIGSRATIDQNFKENGVSIEVPNVHSIDKKFVESDNFYKAGFNASLSVQYEFKKKIALNLGVGSRFTPFVSTKLFQSPERKMPLNVELGLIKRF